MGISTAKFGNPEIIDVLINGLVDPRFKELQSSLIVKASIDQDLTPESIKKTIRIFSSKTQIWKNHSTKNQRNQIQILPRYSSNI
jgi:polyhydroxyalkanoate synthesis regulator phasin